MNNSTTISPRTGDKEPQSAYGAQIAQTALKSIGTSAKEIRGMTTRSTEYAIAVSILFTKATNQAIMLGTQPHHVLSTSLLWNSLVHDKRFKPVPMSEAAPGDIIVASGWRQATEFAGIVVDHGRIVGMEAAETVQNNSSLTEIQRNCQPMAVFRYIGVQRYPSLPLANQGYDSNEARLPAGQPGGGQWTSTGAGGLQMAPSKTVLSGGNRWTAGDKIPDSQAFDDAVDYLGDVAEVWKGYGDAITETVSGLWNAALHPGDTAKGVAEGVAHIVKDPAGTLKAIGQQIADDFTGGDPRKAGRLIGEVLIALAGTEVSAEKLVGLLSKVRAAAAGRAVTFTDEEAGILQKVLSENNLGPATKVARSEQMQEWTNPITAKPGQMQTIDPASVKAGEQTALRESRIATQKSLIETGTPRAKGPPQVNEQGVVLDGHHHLRAAAEKGRLVAVKVVHAPEFESVTEKPVTKLPTY